MAKKELKDDLFDGVSISDDGKKNKSANAKEARAKKKAAKLAEKRTACENEIRELKSKLASETDENKKAELQKQLTKAKNKLDSIGSGISVAKNTARVIKSVVAAVVVVALLVTYVATGTVRKGPIHSTLQWTTGLTAITIKSEDGDKLRVPVSVYNYYYSTMYNSLQQTQQVYKQYGIDLAQADLEVDFDKKLSSQKTTDEDNVVMTWEEKLQKKVVKSIEDIYTYYNEAVKANGGEEPEITEEQQKQLDDTLKSYKESANKYGFTLSAYLVKAMGKGVTESVFREETKRSCIAENYQKELEANKEEVVFTEADFAKYKDENPDELATVDIRVFEASSADDAKAFKEALKADGSNFTELCVNYAKEGYEKTYYAQDGASTEYNISKSTLKAMGLAIATADDVKKKPEERTYEGLDWLFSADRKAGDINQFATTVVYVLAPARVSDAELVNVRHILINPITDAKSDKKAIDATAEQWAEADKLAKKVLDEYNKGEKSAESFGALAKKYSADGSSTKGGLYENVYPNQMVDTFNAWCFDANRKVGDVGIVQTEFGYHVMYFVGTTGTAAWEKNAKDALEKQDKESVAKALDDKYTAKVSWFGSRYFEKDTDIDR